MNRVVTVIESCRYRKGMVSLLEMNRVVTGNESSRCWK